MLVLCVRWFNEVRVVRKQEKDGFRSKCVRVVSKQSQHVSYEKSYEKKNEIGRMCVCVCVCMVECSLIPSKTEVHFLLPFLPHVLWFIFLTFLFCYSPNFSKITFCYCFYRSWSNRGLQPTGKITSGSRQNFLP